MKKRGTGGVRVYGKQKGGVWSDSLGTTVVDENNELIVAGHKVAFCTKEIDLVCCPSNDMLADIFTKGVSAEKFSRLRRKLGVVFFEKHIQCEKEC
ncbi:hypothetical protein FHG87_008354 [Trinorchestia longiramus]|nr:hypothetical protein FHG87_008354 [Trinorchestia longiramus]